MELDENNSDKTLLQLFRYVADDNCEAVESILEENWRDINIESRDKSGKTLLMVCIFNHHFKRTTSNNFYYITKVACQKGSAHLISILIRYKAILTSKTISHKSPLVSS